MNGLSGSVLVLFCRRPRLGEGKQKLARELDARSVTWLPESYDVDELSDLPTARRALAADNRPARRRLHWLLLSV
jgi:hypothetical protein